MKLAQGFAITLAATAAGLSSCASAPNQDTTPTSSSPASPSPATSTQPTPAAQPATVVTTTTTTRPAAPSTPPAGKKSQYSCFSYAAGNAKTLHACMRTDDCVAYLEQAKTVRGFRELSGCANVATVHCFHIVATKEEPDGLDFCQPTLDTCKVARADAVKAKMSVDSDCRQN